MRECLKCWPSVQSKVEAFASRWNIRGGMSLVRDSLIRSIEMEFPGVFGMLSNPEQWFGSPTPSWFPVSSEKLKNARFHIEVVHSPLNPTSLFAACVRAQCTECNLTHHVIHLNVAALILNTHLIASAQGTGLMNDDLSKLLCELQQTGLPSQSTLHPPHMPEAIRGIAWVLLHEYGHILASEMGVSLPDNTPGPHPDVKAELEADLMAFRVLQHRYHAKGIPLGEGETHLLFSIQAFLATASLIIGKRIGMTTRIREMPLLLAPSVPSLKLRLINIENFVSVCFSIGPTDVSLIRSKYDQVYNDLNKILESL